MQDAERIAKEGLAFETTLGPDAWLDHGMAHALYFQGWEAKFLCDESANNMQKHTLKNMQNYKHLVLDFGSEFFFKK